MWENGLQATHTTSRSIARGSGLYCEIAWANLIRWADKPGLPLGEHCNASDVLCALCEHQVTWAYLHKAVGNVSATHWVVDLWPEDVKHPFIVGTSRQKVVTVVGTVDADGGLGTVPEGITDFFFTINV